MQSTPENKFKKNRYFELSIKTIICCMFLLKNKNYFKKQLAQKYFESVACM